MTYKKRGSIQSLWLSNIFWTIWERNWRRWFNLCWDLWRWDWNYSLLHYSNSCSFRYHKWHQYWYSWGKKHYELKSWRRWNCWFGLWIMVPICIWSKYLLVLSNFELLEDSSISPKNGGWKIKNWIPFKVSLEETINNPFNAWFQRNLCLGLTLLELIEKLPMKVKIHKWFKCKYASFQKHLK